MSIVTETSQLDALNHGFTKLFYSLAGYMLETNPYLTPADKGAVAAVREVAAFDAGLIAECVTQIEALGGIPQCGAPNPRMAELNYLSYPFLLDVLIDDCGKQADEFTAWTESAEGKAREFIAALAASRTRQVGTLRDLRAANYPEG